MASGPSAAVHPSLSFCVWLAISKATEWQRIGNQIDAAFIFARADFVNVHGRNQPMESWPHHSPFGN
jgi:hypothetical protein